MFNQSAEQRTIQKTDQSNIRVAFQQPSLAAYRVAFFRELGSRDGIVLKLWYGDRKGISNAAPDGFDASPVPLRRWKIGPIPIYWHKAQLNAISPKNVDVAVLVWNVQYVSLLYSLWRARRSGVRTLLWGHGYSKTEKPWRQRLRYGVAKFADAVVFYDAVSAQRAIRDELIPESKVFVAPNAIDDKPIVDAIEAVTGQATPSNDPVGFRRSSKVMESLAQFRSRHDLDPEKTLLFVSRLHASNHLDWAIRSMATLPTKLSDTRLVIIGSGEQESVRLRDLANEYGLGNRVLMIGAIYDENELASWFLSARAFVYPANIGLSLFHAMHYGLPAVTVAESHRQNPEFFSIRHDENGVTFEAPDEQRAIKNLADRIERLLSDDEYHGRISNEAFTYVRTHQSLVAMANGFEKAIRTTAGC